MRALYKNGAITGTLLAVGGLGITIALAFAGWVAAETNFLQSELTQHQTNDTEQAKQLASTEATVSAIDTRTTRIENKIDQLIRK